MTSARPSSTTSPQRRAGSCTARTQVGLGERTEEHLAGREPVGELGEGAELAVQVGPHGDDQPAGMGDDGVHEGGPLGGVVAQRDQLLELVDDEDGRLVTGDARPLE